MAWGIYDRICETSTTTGTGALTLAGAVPGYQAFDDYLTVGSTVNYLVEAVDGSGVPTGDWETGLGTYSATNVLTRTHPWDGSNTTPITLAAGTKRVHLAVTADSIRPQFARMRRTTSLTALNASAALTAVTWETLYYQTASGFIDIAGAPTRITIPTSLTARLVRLTAAIVVDNIASGTELEGQFNLNGTATDGYGYNRVVATATNKAVIKLDTGIISAAVSDYFQAMLKSADTSIDLTPFSWCQVEVFGQF